MCPIPALTRHTGAVSHGSEGSNLSLFLDRLSEEVDPHGENNAKPESFRKRTDFRIKDAQLEAYQHAYQRWLDAWRTLPDAELICIETATPMFLGTGNANLQESGVTLLRPWGVPYIPGSAIKGCVSSWLAKQGGAAWHREHTKKSAWQAKLFGGVFDKQSWIGSVVFGDGWWVPEARPTFWFEKDMTTVHYREYYAGRRLPDGVESPNPIPTCTLRAGLQFMVVVQGSESHRNFVISALEDVLINQGIGAKTSVGYGRCKMFKSQRVLIDIFRRATTANDIEAALTTETISNEGPVANAVNDAMQKLDAMAISRDSHKKCSEWIQKNMPIKWFRIRLDQQKPDTLKAMGDLQNQQFKKAANAANPRDPDVRAIFEYCMRLAIKEGREIKGSWFEKLSYSWSELSPDTEALMEIIDNKDWVWPPKSDLGVHIEARTDLGDDKDVLQEMLMLAIEESG
jgi:CRISPR type III-B/RAMP module RAMP protein Cmr6